jgi:hypothetical protein
MKADGRRQKAKRQAPAASFALLTIRLLPFAFCFSCASLPELPWAPPARDASAGFYETARIEYRLDAGKLGQPIDAVRVDGRQVAYEQIASSPLAEQSIGTLVVQYPHPGGTPDLARVTFTLDSNRPESESDGVNPLRTGTPVGIQPRHEEVHEVWAMDIPRAECDRYFQLLSAQNFYRAAAVDSGGAQLAVTINGRQLRKNWEQVAELNLLAQRVRREGQLVGYLRPGALVGAPSSRIASTHAFRAMLARADRAASDKGAPAAGRVLSEPEAANVRTASRVPYAAR